MSARVLTDSELDEFRRLRTFTVEEIDEHLGFISNVIRVGRKANRDDCFKRADAWLDMRLELTEAGEYNNNGT